MDIEIITIGDELLIGATIDTNAAYIAQAVSGAGFRVRYKSSVGDIIEEMEEAFRLALRRAHIVITTGGLGPTDDDLTKRAIVRLFKRNLIFHEDILEDIKQRFAGRGLEMPAINHNQALLPQGAHFFPNKFGSALGICITEQGRTFISLPGVPTEMKQMIDDEIVPYLSKLQSSETTKMTTIHTTGIVESRLAEMIKPALKLESGVKLAYLPAYSGVSLRVISSGKNQDEVDDKRKRLVEHIEKTIGKYIYGYDDDTLEIVIAQLLKDNDKSISVAESCTGGMLGATITAVPGASDFFIGGLLAYDNEVKRDRLEVSEDILKNNGAVSEECAQAMAVGCRKMFATDYALSITGIAGPDGGTDEKPVGTTYIGMASAHATKTRMLKFGRNRETNRTRAVYAALEMLRRDILDLN